MYKQLSCFLLLLITGLSTHAGVERFILKWSDSIHTQDSVSFLFLENGTNDVSRDFLPIYTALLPMPSNVASVSVIVESYESQPLSEQETQIIQGNSFLKSTIELDYKIAKSGGRNFLSLVIPGIFREGNTLSKISSIELNWQVTGIKSGAGATSKRGQRVVASSQLPSGSLAKFAILKSGAQKITYETLKESNVLSGPMSSTKIGIYGGSGGMTPYLVPSAAAETTQQLPIEIVDGNDGMFGPNDYLLFYGEAGSKFYYDETEQRFLFNNNLYSDTNFVFVYTSENDPKRIQTTDNSGLTAVATLTTRTACMHHEAEIFNLLSSGRKWLGESFLPQRKLNFRLPTSHQPLENIWLRISTSTGSRSFSNNSYQIIANGDTVGQFSVPIISGASYSNKLAEKSYTTFFQDPNPELNLEILYNQDDPAATAYLDYFTVNYETTSSVKDSAILLWNRSSILNPDIYQFRVMHASNRTRVWTIDDLFQIRQLSARITGDSLFFISNTNTNREFIAFNPDQTHTPKYITNTNNVSLPSSSANLIVVTPPFFKSQANEIAKIHQQVDGLSYIVAPTELIYNHFSSGRKEAGAIRNYIKSIYDQSSGNDSLKYVLLLGTGSYDPKNRLPNNIDLVPVYESKNSIRETESYVTDDFYGVMDPGEGEFTNGDLLDLAVGRIPAKDQNEADIAVKKIKQYYNIYNEVQDNGQPYKNQESWRNKVVFVADDGDSNDHMNQADQLATIVDTELQEINVIKIYSDQFLQTESPGGKRYPDGAKAVIDNFNRGALIINYTGHGGGFGWSGERILDFNSIYQLKNKTRLPLIMTATCEFSRFDDPDRLSAGEILLFRENAGAIALFTTVRVVYSIPNFNLNKKLYQILGELSPHQSITMGELFKETKIRNNVTINDRNFTLLGDPALKLMLPNKKVEIDSLTTWNSTKTDTIKALTQGEIHGKIRATDGSIDTTFSGNVEIKIFDQKTLRKTLNNNNDGPFTYTTQESLLFKGNAGVEKGQYICPFIIPKDAISSFGKAKISAYAVDQVTHDAAGYSAAITIGGVDSLAPNDRVGPEISVYLNDSSFSFGDVVAPEPYLIANFKDESGVNLMPSNFEQNIILTLNNEINEQRILNDYYQSEKNNFKKGSLTLQLEELNTGKHTLKLAASDNYNNNSEAYTEFIIEENAELALAHVLNYPNPFTTNTSFYFEQNQRSGFLDVQIQIFTISGRIIKTILTSVDGSNPRIGPISWDGKDDFGDPIGRGVYLYKLSAKTIDGEAISTMEKLVILR